MARSKVAKLDSRTRTRTTLARQPKPLPALVADAREIEQFLFHEAACLDDRGRWEDWLNLFTDDGFYWVPYNKDQPDPINYPSIIYEDRILRAVRIGKLLHPRSWSQQPPSRTARVIGNIRLEGQDATGDLVVRSTFTMMEFRRDTYQPYCGSYEHHLRRAKGGWKIAMKRVDLISADGIYEHIIQVPI
jgi:3-phenylpropionate/cinnamic acid dioxygenase small subunit